MTRPNEGGNETTVAATALGLAIAIVLPIPIHWQFQLALIAVLTVIFTNVIGRNYGASTIRAVIGYKVGARIVIAVGIVLVVGLAAYAELKVQHLTLSDIARELTTPSPLIGPRFILASSIAGMVAALIGVIDLKAVKRLPMHSQTMGWWLLSIVMQFMAGVSALAIVSVVLPSKWTESISIWIGAGAIAAIALRAQVLVAGVGGRRVAIGPGTFLQIIDERLYIATDRLAVLLRHDRLAQAAQNVKGFPTFQLQEAVESEIAARHGDSHIEDLALVSQLLNDPTLTEYRKRLLLLSMLKAHELQRVLDRYASHSNSGPTGRQP